MSRFDPPKWTLNDRELKSNEFVRIQSNADDNLISKTEILIIDNVQRYHEGFYRCNQYSNNFHFVFVIRINEQQAIIHHPVLHPLSTDHNNEIKIKNNDSIKLECHLIDNSSANINW